MWCTSTQPASARRPETRWRFHLSRGPGFGVHFSPWRRQDRRRKWFGRFGGTPAGGSWPKRRFGSCWRGSAGKRASRRSAAAKAWRRISITAGAKNSLRPARSGCWAIRHAKRRRRKSRTCAAKTANSSRSWPRRSSRIAYSKKSGGLRCGGRYVRLTAAEKHEIIRLVEGSDLSVRRTLRELGGSPVHVLRVVSPLPGRGRGRGGPPAGGRPAPLEPYPAAGPAPRRGGRPGRSGKVAPRAGVAVHGPGAPLSLGVQRVSHPQSRGSDHQSGVCGALGGQDICSSDAPAQRVVANRLHLPAGGTVKLTKSSAIDPQDTGLEPVVNPPCWASETLVSLNLTIPLLINRRLVVFVDHVRAGIDDVVKQAWRDFPDPRHGVHPIARR